MHKLKWYIYYHSLYVTIPKDKTFLEYSFYAIALGMLGIHCFYINRFNDGIIRMGLWYAGTWLIIFTALLSPPYEQIILTGATILCWLVYLYGIIFELLPLFLVRDILNS